jgi:hypothetical protein
METEQDYEPTRSHQATNTLYGNHYRFSIERLPDLTFFVQSVSSPSVSGGTTVQENPFAFIKHPGDRLTYGQFSVTYLVDASFKTYFSLYYWMKGYGFPHDFDEVERFRAKQLLNSQVSPLARPIDLEKTTATISILTPDTASIVAEIQIDEVFPVELSSLDFASTDSDSPILSTTATFACSTFDVTLT